LFFLRNIRVFGWPQGSEVCSYLGFKSALGYALGIVYLFAAAAEVVVTQSQPERMSPYKTGAREGI